MEHGQFLTTPIYGYVPLLVPLVATGVRGLLAPSAVLAKHLSRDILTSLDHPVRAEGGLFFCNLRVTEEKRNEARYANDDHSRVWDDRGSRGRCWLPSVRPTTFRKSIWCRQPTARLGMFRPLLDLALQKKRRRRTPWDPAHTSALICRPAWAQIVARASMLLRMPPAIYFI